MQGTIDPGEQNNIIVLYDDIVFSRPSLAGGGQKDLRMSLLQESGWRDMKREYTEEDPLPDSSPMPCILWIPGGGWNHADRNFMTGEMTYLARAGYTVASMTYRNSAEGHMPDQLEDVRAALDFLRTEGPKYRIDPHRIGVMGRSAGAYFAVWAALNRDPAYPVKACCDMFGPVDLEALIRYELSDEVIAVSKADRPEDSHAGKLLGLTGSETMEEVLKEAADRSPLNCIPDTMCPMLILHGDNDPVVPKEISSDRLYQKIREAGLEDRTEYFTVRHAGHGSREFFQEAVQQKIIEFFDRSLR